MVQVNAPGQPELLGELPGAVSPDDLCAHIGRVCDDEVIGFRRAEQTAREVVKDMV